MENGVLKVLGKDRTKETTCITTSNIKKDNQHSNEC